VQASGPVAAGMTSWAAAGAASSVARTATRAVRPLRRGGGGEFQLFHDDFFMVNGFPHYAGYAYEKKGNIQN